MRLMVAHVAPQGPDASGGVFPGLSKNRASYRGTRYFVAGDCRQPAADCTSMR